MNESKIVRLKLVLREKFSRILKNKRCLVATGTILGGLTLMYVIGGLYFSNHFYWGTTINGMDVGGYSIEQATTSLEKLSDDYTLELNE